MRTLAAGMWSSFPEISCTSVSCLSREPTISTLRGNSPQGSLGHSRSRQGVARSLISWSYLQSFRVCTTFSTCHNFGSVFKRQTIQIFIRTSNVKPLTFNLTSVIVRDRSTSWTKPSVVLEDAPSSTSRFSGEITPKQKQHGSVKTISDPNFRTFLAPSIGISGTRFL